MVRSSLEPKDMYDFSHSTLQLYMTYYPLSTVGLLAGYSISQYTLLHQKPGFNDRLTSGAHWIYHPDEVFPSRFISLL